jgi:hypothetical protein
MRVLRMVAGILTLLLALPVLAAGILGWWTMQHRSPDGAFHATITSIDAPNRVLVVPDLDALLRRDAPIARAERTTLRLSTPGFIGIAHPADVAAYLAGTGYTAVDGLSLGRGPLPVRARNITAAGGEQLSKPQDQDFWVRGGEGELVWTPAVDREQELALVIVAPEGSGPISLNASVTAGWLASTTWGLLILGPVLLLLGLAMLAWPARPREIVYIMDPAVAASSLPALASGRTVIHVPTQPSALPAAQPPAEPVSPQVEETPEMPWPPSESGVATEPPRDLPMPMAGAHLHLMKQP